MYTSGSSVQCQLPNLRGTLASRHNINSCGYTHRDSNAVDAKIAKSQDTRAICYNADRRRGVRPIAEYGGDGLPLLDRDVQSLGSGIQRRVLEAHVSNCRRIYEGHHLGDIINQEAVEEVDVLGFEGGEVEVFVNVGASAVDHAQSSHALSLEAL